MTEPEAWQAWRAARPEADERDIGARDAHTAGWTAARLAYPGTTWHQSLSLLLICVAIIAGVCYFLAGAPH